MKKIFSVLLVLCFSLSMIFAVDIATVKWALKTPKSTNYVRYQVNDENDDNWTVVEYDKTGYITVDIDSPVNLPSTLYVQQSIDGIIWSESVSKTITAETVQAVYDKTHMKEVVIKVPSINYEMDINSAFTSDDMTTNVEDANRIEQERQAETEIETTSSSNSAFKFTFLAKPSVTLNLQKVSPLSPSSYWDSLYEADGPWTKDGKKDSTLSAADLAPRLDFEFRFENIAGKKGDLFGFDAGFSVGYETRPYAGWDAKDAEDKTIATSYFMDPDYWYHKVNIDVRLGGAFNLANDLVRPYFGIGAGAEFVIAKDLSQPDRTSFGLFSNKFQLIESKLDDNGNYSLGLFLQPYVLGTLGVRFTFGQFTFGIEGTYKVFVVGTDKDKDIWHKMDTTLLLGGTFSI